MGRCGDDNGSSDEGGDGGAEVQEGSATEAGEGTRGAPLVGSLHMERFKYGDRVKQAQCGMHAHVFGTVVGMWDVTRSDTGQIEKFFRVDFDHQRLNGNLQALPMVVSREVRRDKLE